MRKIASAALVGLLLFTSLADAAGPIKVSGKNNTVQVVNGGGGAPVSAIASARTHLAGVPLSGFHGSIAHFNQHVAGYRSHVAFDPGVHYAYRARLAAFDPGVAYGYSNRTVLFDPGYAQPAFDPGYATAGYRYSLATGACGAAPAVVPRTVLPPLAPAAQQTTTTTTVTTTTTATAVGP